MKKNKQSSSPKKDLKIVIIIGGIIFVALCVAFVVYVLPILQIFYTADRLSREGLEKNPAKQLASIMIPFAKEHQLEKTDEENSPIGVVPFSVNSMPQFRYYYQTNQSRSQIYDLVKTYLIKEGYKITENGSLGGFIKIENGSFEGKNRYEDKVIVLISTPETDNTIPVGSIELQTQFTSHECAGCNLRAQDNRGKKDLDRLIASFAENNRLTKITDFADLEYEDNYIVLFKGKQNNETIHQLITEYLEKKGYVVEDEFYTYNDECQGKCFPTGQAINNSKPYWIFRADQENHDIGISGEITDKTYTADFYEAFGENLVPQGETVLKLTTH